MPYKKDGKFPEILSAEFCKNLTFPKTRRPAALNGLRYERKIAAEFEKFSKEFHSKNPNNIFLKIFHNPWISYETYCEKTYYEKLRYCEKKYCEKYPLCENKLCEKLNLCEKLYCEKLQNCEKTIRFCSPDFLIITNSYEILLKIEQIKNQKLIHCEKILNFNNINAEKTINLRTFSENLLNLKTLEGLLIILVEVKSSYTEISHKKNSELYLPCLKKLFLPSCEILSTVICKNLNSKIPNPATFNLLDSFKFDFPLMQWLGNGKLNFS